MPTVNPEKKYMQKPTKKRRKNNRFLIYFLLEIDKNIANLNTIWNDVSAGVHFIRPRTSQTNQAFLSWKCTLNCPELSPQQKSANSFQKYPIRGVRWGKLKDRLNDIDVSPRFKI